MGKYRVLFSLIVLLSISAVSFATTYTWDRGAATSNWNTAQNWSSDHLPNNTADYASIQRTDGPIVPSGTTVNAWRILLNGTGNGTLTVDGGTVNVGNHMYIGDIASAVGTLNVNSGTVNITGTIYLSNNATSVGTINLLGGSITCATLNVNYNSGSGGHIDLRGSGKLTYTAINQQINTLIANDYITAYGGLGTVVVDTTTVPGKTVLTGFISPKAAIPRPTTGAANAVYNSTVLGWNPGVGSVSHDIYLGTTFADVNSAEPFDGDLDYNGIVDFKDLSIMAQSWMLNPTGTNPYAGVNTDNIVDLVDYTLLSKDWKGSSIFKGNQDPNTFSPGTLAFGTTYYWRVDEVNEPNTYKGDIWSFSTHSGKASIMAPMYGDQNVRSKGVLSWTAAPGAISHDVYFGTINPPPLVGNQTALYYNPGGMENSKQYYWRIGEHYAGGIATILGDVWTFTTMSASAEPDIVFVHATDPQMEWLQCHADGSDDPLWGVTIDKINQINPDFVLVTGDLVNSSTSSTQVVEYKNYKAALNPAIECYEVPGNHDLGEPPNQSKYDAWHTNYGYGTVAPYVPWYKFEYGNNLFIGLDTVVLVTPFSGKDVEQIEWLTATLADANTKGYDHIFAFQHYGYTADKWVSGSPIKTQLYNLFDQYHVTALFAGHTHYDAYSLVNGMEDITERSCTCNLGTISPAPGIGIIKVYADHIEHESRSLDSLPMGTATMTAGPYLIYPGNNTQMKVMWKVNAGTSSSNISWGTDTTYSLGSVYTTEYGTDHQHQYTITGLTPGTKYYYRVSVSGASYTGSFNAAPASDAANVKFFMYGDTRTNIGSNNALCARMISDYGSDPAYQTMVLHAGDWVSSDTEAQWAIAGTAEWFDPNYLTNTNLKTATRNMAFMGCAGNHEQNGDSGSMRTVFRKYMDFPYVAAAPKLYYSYDYGPVHVTVLDQTETNGGAEAMTISATQLTWLENDLAASTKPWKIIVLHAPGWQAAGGHINNTQVQNDIQPLCVRYGVQIVLGGHVHYYSRAIVSGVQHVTSGAGGAPSYTPVAGQPNVVIYGTGPEYCKVAISGTTLTCNVYNSSGTSLDSFTVTR